MPKNSSEKRKGQQENCDEPNCKIGCNCGDVKQKRKGNQTNEKA